MYIKKKEIIKKMNSETKKKKRKTTLKIQYVMKVYIIILYL